MVVTDSCPCKAADKFRDAKVWVWYRECRRRQCQHHFGSTGRRVDEALDIRRVEGNKA